MKRKENISLENKRDRNTMKNKDSKRKKTLNYKTNATEIKKK